MISIVGSGRVGSQIAAQLVAHAVDDITLIDIREGLPQAQSIDLLHMASALEVDVAIKGSNDFMNLLGSEIVVVAAGSARQPGMSRLDLDKANRETIMAVSEAIAEHASGAKVLVVTNPVDVMTYLLLKSTGFSRSNVFGLGGIVDSVRFRYYLSEVGGVSRSSVEALVVGEHGDSMVPLPRRSTIAGSPVNQVLDRPKIEYAIEKTLTSGGEILVKLKGASVFGPAAAAFRIIDSISRNRKKVLCASVYLQDEYGVDDICISVPVIFGKDGAERILEVELDPSEREAFLKSVATVREALKKIHS